MKTTFGEVPVGALFKRNGMQWRKELFPSGANARYMGTDGRYFSATFRDFQDVTLIEKGRK
jgi:hypothetical protein